MTGEDLRAVMRGKVRAMLNENPDMYRAMLIQVGPHYTIEHHVISGERGMWEAKYGEGYFGLYDTPGDAISAIALTEDELSIPQDVSILVDHNGNRVGPVESQQIIKSGPGRKLNERDHATMVKMMEYLGKLYANLEAAVLSGDLDLIHNAARNLRISAGSIEREVKA